MIVDKYELDGKEYGVVDTISGDRNNYCILVNLNDNNDFCVRKYIVIDDKKYVSKLEMDELKEFYLLYGDKIKKFIEKK